MTHLLLGYIAVTVTLIVLAGAVSPIPHHCASCHRPLDWAEGEWLHTKLVLDSSIPEHEPEPVPTVDQADLVTACDFCAAAGAAWVYPCENFEHADAQYGSVGDWGACQPCHDDIEQARWDAILVRTMQHFEKRYGSIGTAGRRAMRRRIRELHKLFREHRVGAAEPV